MPAATQIEEKGGADAAPGKFRRSQRLSTIRLDLLKVRGRLA